MIKTKARPFFYPAILLLLCLFIAFKSYTPGTYLTGWDTLHPEFDFPLNFQRLVFGVWRSEQGLGAAAGHSHMADLPRVFILWLFHFVFPLNFLRYAYVYLCLILGPLGFYFFLSRLPLSPSAAFLGGLVYLFNLSTVQQFYLPFEMFPTQWAYLPWVMAYTVQYLRHPSRRHLLLFSLATVFSTPQAYAAHLWYPFFLVYCLFLLLFSLHNRIKKHQPIILLFLTVAFNSFWLFPNLYYTLTSSQIPRQNQNNRLHSQEFLLKNRETGNLVDSALIKGFYFNWEIYDHQTKSFVRLLADWRQHLTYDDILLVGYLVFNLAVIGGLLAVFGKRKLVIPFLPFFLIPFVLLSNRVFPFNLVFDLLIKIPLLQEIFRFIFTKVSILYLFGLGLFFAYSISRFFTLFPRFTRPLTIFASLALAVYGYPLLQGKLISPQVKVAIPNDYFLLNSFLKNQPPGTILALPLHEPSGWSYYSWGYQGSGFIWFGLPQSITDRDFDRWNYQNEQSYREFFYTLYSNNPDRFYQTVSKYNINYILWDTSSISTSPKNPDQITFKNEIDQILESLQQQGLVTPLNRFGAVSLFQVNHAKPLVTLQQINKTVNPAYHWGYYDFHYQNQNYLSGNPPSPALPNYYPFRAVLDLQNKIDPDLLKISQNPTGQWIIDLNGSIFTVHRPLTYSHRQLRQLDPSNPNLFFDPVNQALTYQSQGQTNGTAIVDSSIPHDTGLIIGFNSRYLSGLPLRYCLKNTYSHVCTLNDELAKNQQFHWDFVLVPPTDNDTGYEFHLNAISFAGQLSQSQVRQIIILPVPYETLNHTLFNFQPDLPNGQIDQPPFIALWPNRSLLKVNLPSVSSSSTLVLHQSFSPHWLAFTIQNSRPKIVSQHFLVNNWANGWKITPQKVPQTVYLLFWPQILQFLGAFLVIPALFLVLSRRP